MVLARHARGRHQGTTPQRVAEPSPSHRRVISTHFTNHAVLTNLTQHHNHLDDVCAVLQHAIVRFVSLPNGDWSMRITNLGRE